MASLRPYAGNAGFDVLTTHVADLQALLDSGRLTSVDLVGKYLAQIKQHNTAGMGVRALISIAPRMSLLKQASDLDIERKLQGRRGPMHGIPVIVKVSDTLNAATV
jgi:amidase